ncbi:MAG: cell division protein FtsL [Bacillota bacterium]
MVVAQEQPYYSSLPKKSRQTRRKTRAYYLPRRERLVLTGLVLLVFCAAIIVVYCYAQVIIAGYQLNKMKKDINDLHIQTQAMTENVARLSSLERVERVATTKLGMVKPDTSRMILVKADPEALGSQRNPGEEKAGQPPEAVALKSGEKKNWLIQAFVRLVAGRGDPGQG